MHWNDNLLMEMSLVQWILNIRVPSLVKVLDQILQQVIGNSGTSKNKKTDFCLGFMVCVYTYIQVVGPSSIPNVHVYTYMYISQYFLILSFSFGLH